MKPKLIIGNKNYSSWSLRAWFLLREADIDFDEHRIALDVEDTARQIAEFSPAGKVPVLLHGDGRWDFGPCGDVLTEERLSALYGSPLHEVAWRGRRVFVAG